MISEAHTISETRQVDDLTTCEIRDIEEYRKSSDIKRHCKRSKKNSTDNNVGLCTSAFIPKTIQKPRPKYTWSGPHKLRTLFA